MELTQFLMHTPSSSSYTSLIPITAPSLYFLPSLLNAMRNKMDEGMNQELETPSPRFPEHPNIEEAHRPLPVQVSTLTSKPLTFSTVLNILYYHGQCQNEWIINAMTCFYCFTVNKHLKRAAPPGSSGWLRTSRFYICSSAWQAASYSAPAPDLFCSPSCSYHRETHLLAKENFQPDFRTTDDQWSSGYKINICSSLTCIFPIRNIWQAEYWQHYNY